MKNWKLFSLGLAIFGGVTMISCSKSNNNSPASSADSVLYSSWVTLNMTYQGKDANNDSIFSTNVAAPGITNAVLDRGAVLTYANLGSSTVYNAADIGLYPSFDVGQIALVSYGTNYSGALFRYVIVPGRITTGSISDPMKGYTPAQLKALSYPDAMKLLNAPASGPSANTLK